MTRYILRYRGEGTQPKKDLERIHKSPAVKVIDDSPRMVLVEGNADDLAALAKALPQWSVSPERSIPLPDTRKKVKNAEETQPAKVSTSGKRPAG